MGIIGFPNTKPMSINGSRSAVRGALSAVGQPPHPKKPRMRMRPRLRTPPSSLVDGTDTFRCETTRSQFPCPVLQFVSPRRHRRRSALRDTAAPVPDPSLQLHAPAAVYYIALLANEK